jgi:hypothetical protein
MSETETTPFHKAQEFNFDSQRNLGKELRDYSLRLAHEGEEPNSLRLAIRGLAHAYFIFGNDEALDYLVDLLEEEVDKNRPNLCGVDLGTLATDLASLAGAKEKIREKIKRIANGGEQ